jgi:lipid A 3-O-deacylase
VTSGFEPARSKLIAVILVVAAVAGVLAASQKAAAQSLIDEVKLGILYHDAPNMWSGFRLEHEGIDINFEALLRPSLPLLMGTIRPVVGGTISTRGDTSHGYLGARWQMETASGVFFGLGLGAAVHDGHTLPDSVTRKALGSPVLFHIPAEIGLRLDSHNSISVYFEHTSNAWFAHYNEGMDRIGVRYGYRF